MKIIRTRFSLYRKKKSEKENFQYMRHGDRGTLGQCNTIKLNLCVSYTTLQNTGFC